MKVLRKCETCGKSFYASTANQRYCCEACRTKHANTIYYDRFRKNDRAPLASSRIETYAQKIVKIKEKEILTISEAATFIGVSRPTMYSYIRKNNIYVKRLGRKSFIRPIDLELLQFKTGYNEFRPAIITKKEQTSQKPDRNILSEDVDLSDYWTTLEAAVAHNICADHLRHIGNTQGFTKYYKNGKMYWNKKEMEQYFKKNYQSENSDTINEWYSIQDIKNIFGLSERNINWVISTNNIPKKRMGRIMLYSKVHFDIARGIGAIDNTKYISFKEVMDEYGLTLKQATGVAQKRGFAKTKILNHTYTFREDWEKWNENRSKGSKNPALEHSET